MGDARSARSGTRIATQRAACRLNPARDRSEHRGSRLGQGADGEIQIQVDEQFLELLVPDEEVSGVHRGPAVLAEQPERAHLAEERAEFFLPVSQMWLSLSCLPRSSVLNHPGKGQMRSFCFSSAYPLNTFGPLMQTSPISSVLASRTNRPSSSHIKIFIC